ncbi:SDR family NAD(P)-dependent oxidoreductase [Sinimarinibacterium flocculans]|nr:SDR family NAD(P)-dependent oxidoreductase [Sinimarinibacterium flocculans]
MLANKSVIVTGGLGALGRVVVSELAAQGARVAVLDCSARPDAGRAEVVYDGVDLCNASATAKAMESIAAQLGGIYGLVNVAGGFRYEPISEGTLDTWDLMYETNLRSCAAACLSVLPYLRSNGSGRIVNIGAASAQRATCGLGAYAASKAGVARLTESLSDELKDQSITVNAVLPSVIDTPANRLQMSGADFTRWVSPTSVAHLVAFLLSDQSIDITGALVPIVGRM